MKNNSLLILLIAIFAIAARCANTNTPPNETDYQPTEPKTETVIQNNDAAAENPVIETPSIPAPIQMGAEQLAAYLPLLKDKKIALVVNQTSTIGGQHLADALLAKGVDIVKIFAPEHGFRGTADAGEKVSDGKDAKTGIPLKSLYGKSKKPTAEDLAEIDLVIFDIQDVGARFYTYISTMHYVMQSCAKYKVDFMVLDRPNPNGHYVDGPVLSADYQSFVGMHEIPIVHGMTVGEYAKMTNEEGWLGDNLRCNLTIIPCQNYDHQMAYDLPIKPSPNLPNLRAIYLYPSLCLFEGTVVNIGRGTERQFQIYGTPNATIGEAYYRPISRDGAKYPKFENKKCRGFDLSEMPLEIMREKQLDLSYLLDFYNSYPDKSSFFLKNKFFDTLAGTDVLRKQIIEGKTEAEIRATWQVDLDEFKAIRAKYLLYK